MKVITYAIVSIAVLFGWSGCTGDKNTNSKDGKMLFISHRGESYDAPENTLKAFRLAWRRDTGGIELDIRMTADKKIVCIHDPHTGRVGDKKLSVAKESYEALSRLDVGDGEKIPLLSDVLEEAPAGKPVYIEIKAGPEILPFLQKVIKKFPDKVRDLRIISFYSDSLKEAKKIFPDIPMYFITEVKWNKAKRLLEPDADKLISLQKEIKVEGFDLEACGEISEDYLNALKKNNSKIIVWTIDEIAKARKFKALGVDAITSNRAAFLKKNME